MFYHCTKEISGTSIEFLGIFFTNLLNQDSGINEN